MGGAQKQVVVRDQLVTYYVWNEGGADKPTLLFLHGWRSEGRVWESVAKELVGLNMTLVAIDFPGFGKSEIPKKTFDLAEYSEIVLGFIEKLNLKNVILIGHSFGGRVSIKLASSHPQFSKMVLVDSAGFKTQSFIKKSLAKMAKPFFMPSFMKPVREKIYTKIGAGDYLALPEMQQTFLAVIKEDLTSVLPKIQAETLIVWGKNDRDTPVSFAEKLKKGITKSHLETLENAGHYSFLDQPEKFIKILKTFL